jgi:hypothetical protein
MFLALSLSPSLLANPPFALSPMALIWSRSLRSAAACWRWLASFTGILRGHE